MLENAEGRWGRWKHLAGFNTIFGKNQHFTRLHFTFESCINEIERASFGTHDRRTVQPAKTEWSESARIAHHNHFLFSQDDQRVGASDLQQGFLDGFLDGGR